MTASSTRPPRSPRCRASSGTRRASGWSLGLRFSVGGVAAFDPDTGVISPGGIGYDINCGVRLARTSLSWEEVRPRIGALMDLLAPARTRGGRCPGSARPFRDEFREVAVRGARWCIDRGFGWPEDLDMTEGGGVADGADVGAVSPRAIERGLEQVGTLGSGNHYLEVQVSREADRTDPETARAFGVEVRTR